MRLWIGLAAVLAALATAGASAPQAGAATPWLPCVYAAVPMDCAAFDLPLDRSGGVPGTTTVRAVRVAAAEGPRLGTLFVIAGGPGQTAQVMLGLMSQAFGGANRYDLIAVDQRGSGASEPLNCPRVESGTFKWNGSDPATDRPFTDCSVALGPQRAAYNTAEAVADLDAIRSDLGIAQVSLFGVSYGTKVALAYGQAHPANTRSLLLDSVLPVDMPGAFDVDSLAALRGALGQICAANRCRGIGQGPVTNMARLAARLERRPLPTFLVSPTGRITDERIDDSDLYDIAFSADLNLFIYNQLPATLSEALRGRTAQLERLFAIVNGSYGASSSLAGARRLAAEARRTDRPQTRPRPGGQVTGRDAESLAEFSNTMFFATTCADFAPPWPRSTDVAGRQPAIDAAAGAIPQSAFNPFSRRTAAAGSTSAYCRGWQQDPAPPALAPGPLPDIPTLALDGSLDLRTPVSWAERAVAGDPRAQVVRIPNNGHSVIGTDTSGCALSLAKRFLIFGATDGRCRKTAPALPIAPRPARSLSAVRALPGRCRGLRGARCLRARRQLTAGYQALRDSFDQFLIGGSDGGPGLFSGSWTIDYDVDEMLTISPSALSMTDVSNVLGFGTSGTLGLLELPSIDGSLTVAGFRVNVGGRIAQDRSADSLTLSGRRGRTRVTVRIRPRSRGGVAAPESAALKLRRNYTLASVPPVGSPAR
jgi:pimeloyl-ACP methyl ester carboxylesterase